MKDIMKLFEEARAELKAIGIETPDGIPVKINLKALRRYGQCRTRNGKCIEINISGRILESYVDDNVTKGVMIHELLHAVTPYEHHGGEWLRLANVVNKHYPQYQIQRTGSDSAYGLRPMAIKPKYQIECQKCGQLGNYMRMSNVVKYPNHYKCKCGGELKRIA